MQGATDDQRRQARQQHSRPVIDSERLAIPS
jgi:hypothetical protein